MKLLNDILMVNDPEKGEGLHYSQSRVYKLITFLSILIVLSLSLIFEWEFDLVEHASYVLFSMFVLLSGYSLTGKGLQHFKGDKK